jgi:hypothetical protein
MSRAPFETMNLTSSSSEIEGSGTQIEALRELGGNDRTRKKTYSNFEETERGRKGDKPCPGCEKRRMLTFRVDWGNGRSVVSR